MSQHDSLKVRKNQHKAKNILSKDDDKIMFEASLEVVSILKEKYPNNTFE